MFENNTSDLLQQKILADISDDYDKSEGQAVYIFTKPVAIQLSQVYQDMDVAVSKISIDNLSGDELAQRIYERTGLTRKPATKAIGILAVTGNGTINTGAIFTTQSNVQYKATETKTIVVTGTVNIESVNEGAIGNVASNQIVNMPVTITGITSVTNANPTTGGYEAELDADLLTRYYERIQTPSTSGNKAQFRSWVKEVSGVGDARIVPLWNGDNTLKIIIIDSNKQPASTQLIADVQNYIDPNSSGLGDGTVGYIGAYSTAVSATNKPITVTFSATKDSAYTSQQIQANVESQIIEYLKDIAFVETYVSYAKIGSLILQSQGILDYSNLQINNGTSNISILDSEVVTLGGVTIG